MDPADEFHSPYVYVGNNPVKFIDPDGAQAFESKTYQQISLGMNQQERHDFQLGQKLANYTILDLTALSSLAIDPTGVLGTKISSFSFATLSFDIMINSGNSLDLTKPGDYFDSGVSLSTLYFGYRAKNLPQRIIFGSAQVAYDFAPKEMMNLFLGPVIERKNQPKINIEPSQFKNFQIMDVQKNPNLNNLVPIPSLVRCH